MKIISRLTIIVFTALIVFVYNLSGSTPYDMAVNNMADEKTELPIIMYHSFLKDTAAHGKFVISPGQFEEDIKYMKSKGYKAISVSDLLAYSHGNSSLPDKPIMITIDDGYYNNYLYAFPLLKTYNTKAVISPIVKYSELYSSHNENNAYYSHITWEQGKEMVSSGLVEFQNHTYDMHTYEGNIKGIRKIPNESQNHYEKRLYADLYNAHHLIEDNFGFKPQAIAYPFGCYTHDADKVIDELGYKVTFSSEEGINVISPTSSFKNLKRYNRPHGISSEEFFGKMLK